MPTYQHAMKHAGHRDWVEPVARVGYATKGVVYLIIGGLAALAAFTGGGQVGGSESAVRTIGQQPFGQVLLALAAVGLGAYALWRFVQAALDPEHEGDDKEGIAKRVGYAASGVIHAALAVAAGQMAFGSTGGSGGSKETYVAQVMQWPGGTYLIAAIGAIVIGVGLYQFYRAYTGEFEDKLDKTRMSPTERTWSERIGRAGYAARGVVFAIIGYALLQAGLTTDPNEVKGIGGALHTLASESYGMILLGIVAIGLALYGAFQFVNAKYRRIPSPS